jgi:hypothetical protein
VLVADGEEVDGEGPIAVIGPAHHACKTPSEASSDWPAAKSSPGNDGLAVASAK